MRRTHPTETLKMWLRSFHRSEISHGILLTQMDRYPRCPEYSMYTQSSQYECLNVPKQNISRMGFSVRTADWRYTEWRLWKSTCMGDWSEAGLVAQELCHHLRVTVIMIRDLWIG
jgi:hypothetical protein